MKFADLLTMIWHNMWRRKARTILTMIGVVIGASAILTMVSIGSGFQENMVKSMSTLENANTITVLSPTYYQSMGIYQTQDSKKVKILNDKSIKQLEKLDKVKYVTPKVAAQYKVTYKKSEIFSTINGVNIKSTEDSKYLYGRALGNSENREAVVGYKLAAYLLGQKFTEDIDKSELEELLRKKLTFNLTRINADGEEETHQVDVRVVGIMDESGYNDFNIIVPLSVLEDTENWVNDQENYTRKNGYQQLDVVVENPEDVDEVEKKLKDMGYQTSTIKEAIEMIDKTLGVVKTGVGAIGAISLIVAAFGIMNTMNMSIYERTREIGIMKVVGASLNDVKKIFVLEAGAIGFIGGIAGVLLGMTGNFIINLLSKSFMKQGGFGANAKLAVTNISLILFVMVFSTLIGIISGLYPASRAAKLNIINSLKVE